MKKKKITAEELDALAESGADLTPYMKLETARRIHGGSAKKEEGGKPAEPPITTEHGGVRLETDQA